MIKKLGILYKAHSGPGSGPSEKADPGPLEKADPTPKFHCMS